MQNNPTVIKQEHKRSFGLDLVRAIAISLVLIAHFAYKFEHFGFWGVEMFFALSGYLIGQILWKSFSSNDDWSFKRIHNFWSRRWWRTLPNYYLFLFLMLIFHYWQHGVLPSLLRFSYYLWFGQNLLSGSPEFFGVSWSLCIEEWFYLSFPIVLFLISKINLSKRVSFSVTIFVFFVFSVIMRQYLINQGVSHPRGITLARLDAICFGVMVVFIFSGNVARNQLKKIFFALGLLLFFISFYLVYLSGLTYDEIKENQFVLTLTPLAFAFMLPFIENWPGLKLKFVNTAITNISLWSYSIYLSHIPVLFVCYEVFSFMRASSAGNLFSKILALGFTIIISAFIYKKFEVPLTKRRPKEVTNS
ncbi:acyltransferase family protein [Flavobacterium subsaxonicum]|uniref:acyltransferase family protein n=1 Tax=Flavobacterium subsaxonicum TaxID=426226 RepID=UPI00041ED34A|nr:acyltransferase [Flavobacterium subsaxonicum]